MGSGALQHGTPAQRDLLCDPLGMLKNRAEAIQSAREIKLTRAREQRKAYSHFLIFSNKADAFAALAAFTIQHVDASIRQIR